MAGETERARLWFDEAFPLYVAINSPWGGDDGGFANGTFYATWGLFFAMERWDALLQTTGVDFYQMAWPQEVGRFLAYFLPPGAPTGAFGDGAESYLPRIWAELFAAYAQRVTSDVANRHASAWGEIKRARNSHGLLFGPLSPHAADNREPCDSELPDGAVFPSIGWAALHSNFNDQNRTSIYFKSSSYGSFNHSHADQNSFVINARGHALAIDSGYYDGYFSDHRKQWTVQTIAHNAITFDGGKGQATESREAEGRIVAFDHSPDLDYVVGDATNAYGGALTKAVRTLAYLRPDTLVVYDKVESRTARRWEWNIHSLQEMSEYENGNVRIVNGEASLCVEVLRGPATSFSKTNAFPVDPAGKRDERPNQWHGTYRATQASSDAEFLILLTVNCAALEVGALRPLEDGGFSFTLDGRAMQIGATGARLESAAPRE